MNPRNRDARRLRAVRRPHSLILTLSIRPSSKSNDDTSSFRCGSRLLFFSPKSREKCRYPAPEPPLTPTQKYETSCHTCRPQRPVSHCQLWMTVKWKALPNWLGFAWCKRTSNSFPVCLFVSSRLQEIWGLVGSYNCGAWTREVPGGSSGELSCFVPICLCCMFCKITEKIRIQTVSLRPRAWK